MSSSKEVHSKEWANHLLRYGIKILKEWWISPNSTRLAVFYKKRLITGFVERLDRCGYWWQRDRLKNQLYFWLRSLQPHECEVDGGERT